MDRREGYLLMFRIFFIAIRVGLGFRLSCGCCRLPIRGSMVRDGVLSLGCLGFALLCRLLSGSSILGRSIGWGHLHELLMKTTNKTILYIWF